MLSVGLWRGKPLPLVNPASGHCPSNSVIPLSDFVHELLTGNNFEGIENKNRVCLKKMQPLKSWWSLIQLLLQILLALVSCAAQRFTLYTVDFALRAQLPESKSCAQSPSGEFCGDKTNQESIVCVSTACLTLGNTGISFLRRHSMIRLPWQKPGPFVEHYESYEAR